MKEVSLIVVGSESGDWYGLYVDGVLETEGHSIPTYSWTGVIRKHRYFTGIIESYEVSDEWFELHEDFPRYFNDINKEFLID